MIQVFYLHFESTYIKLMSKIELSSFYFSYQPFFFYIFIPFERLNNGRAEYSYISNQIKILLFINLSLLTMFFFLGVEEVIVEGSASPQQLILQQLGHSDLITIPLSSQPLTLTQAPTTANNNSTVRLSHCHDPLPSF